MKTLLSAVLLLLATTASAQDIDSFVELLRSDVKTEKRAIVTRVMGFTEQESEAFWPLYREYEYELDKLTDARVALIKDYAENLGTMTDEKATELADRSFTYRGNRLKLQKKYFGEFSKALSPAKAAKWAQVENQILTLVDLQIASELPLLEKPGAEEQ